MNRLISVLLMFCMLIGVVPVNEAVNNAYAQSAPVYSFNEYVTNSSPDISGLAADSYYIDKYAEGNKGLKIILSPRISRYSVDAGMSGSSVIVFDIVRNGQPDGSLNLVSGNTSFKILKFNKGTIEAYNGNPVGGISTSKPTRIALVIDFETKLCDIYINEKSIVEDYKIISSFVSNAEKLEFSFSSEQNGEYVLIDNINIHQGDKPCKTYPESEFLDEETELDLDTSVSEARIFTNSDFEFIHDLEIGPGSDYKTWHTEENGNKCLEVKQNFKCGSFQIRKGIVSSEMQSIVLEMDIKLINPLSGGFYLSVLRSATSQWSLDAKIESGALLFGGRTIAKLSTSKWTKIALVNDFTKKSYTVYINGEEVASGLPYSGTISDNTYIDQITTLFQNGSDFHILIDNYKLYEGNEPKEISPRTYNPLSTESKIPSDETYAKMTKNAVALHLRSGVLLSNGEKNILKDKPFVENGRTLVPVRAVSEAFDLEVDYDDATATVTVGDRASFVAGSDKLTIGNKEIELDVPAKLVNGRAYLPLRVLCEEVLDKKVYYNDSTISGGMIIISDEEFKAPTDENELQQLNDYILFVRPDADRILKEYKASEVYCEHPRIMINKTELAALKEDIAKGGYKKKWADNLIASADKNLNAKPPVYESYDDTRMAHTAAEMGVTFGMAYLLTGDSKYVDAAWTQLKEVCSWMDWNPSHYLDVGENAADVAMAYDWLYNGLNDNQRKHIEEGLYRNGVMRSALANHGQMDSVN